MDEKEILTDDEQEDGVENKKVDPLYEDSKDEEVKGETTDNEEEDLSDDDDDLDDIIDGDEEDDDLDDIIDGDEEDDDLDDIIDDDEDGEDDEETPVNVRGKKEKKDKNSDKKAEKERKKKERQLAKGKKNKAGLKIVPYEAQEETNPVIRVYNEMARHAYNYDEGMFSRDGISDGKLGEIFNCVLGDFPELFWVKGYSWTSSEVRLDFRCKKPNGELDIKQIERKLNELKNGSKYFTRGINKRTDPYKALLTIYKRLILTIDYDSQGLNAKIDEDISKDDRLRSLHSALVRHKTVCAGYAAAMQYLLQAVGIPCAYVVSEIKNSGCHAFNIAKIGKYCYYLDVTWGDRSNTLNGIKDNDKITYDYCCVPYDEFTKTSAAYLHNHIPNHENYPWFKKELKANRHEYYRYNKAFITKYNEDDIAQIFASTAKRYNSKEDGRFCISLRCTTQGLARQIVNMVINYSNYARIRDKAIRLLAKDRRAAKLLEGKVESVETGDETSVVKIWYAKSAVK